MYLLDREAENGSRYSLLRFTAASTGCILLAYLLSPLWAYRYGLMHTFVESLCVAIAFSSFIVLWYSAQIEASNLVLGMGFLVVAVFDLLHIAFWQGLTLYPIGYYDLGARYWILGRLAEALFLILSTTALSQAIKNKYRALVLTLLLAGGSAAVIYYFPHTLPVLLTPEGITPVKRIIEYVIIAMFIFFIYRIHKGKLDSRFQRDYMLIAMAIAIPSELCFTIFSTFDFYNLLGHLLRVTYYYFLLKAVVEGYLFHPYKMLAMSKLKFAKAFYENQTPMVLTRITDGVWVEINDQYLRMLEFERDELIGRTTREIDCWVDIDDRLDVINLALANGYLKDFETRFRTKTGRTGSILSSLSVINMGGEDFLLISSQDITARKLAEDSLKQSQRLIKQVFDSIPLPVVIVRIEDSRIIVANDIFWERNRLQRGDLVNICQMQYWELIQGFIKEVIDEGRVSNREISFDSPNGSRTLMMSAILVAIDGQRCVLALGDDITQIRECREQIARLENLNLIGQMAASIAHEVRNPMTSLKGFLQLFQTQDRYREDYELMDLMLEELDQVNEIITSFLSLAQKNYVDVKPQDLNESVTNLLPMITADALENDIDVRIELGRIPAIMIDKGEIRQMLLNLARNSIEAMPQGGRLTIGTYEDAKTVNLVIADEGQGIPPEIVEMIGTPFLTTKKNGSGLGMAVCYSIAERYDARITFETSPKGTSFKVSFPVVA